MSRQVSTKCQLVVYLSGNVSEASQVKKKRFRADTKLATYMNVNCQKGLKIKLLTKVGITYTFWYSVLSTGSSFAND